MCGHCCLPKLCPLKSELNLDSYKACSFLFCPLCLCLFVLLDCLSHDCLCIQDEKIAFIMDESNVLDSSFLERINTLLANGEVGFVV